MVISVKWLVLLTLTGVHAQEPRKKNGFMIEEPLLLTQNEDDVSCSIGGCVKRSPGQDEFGPFWANRGKKDPVYMRNKFFADEPHWVLLRREQKINNENEPFFVTRGKKNVVAAHLWRNFFGPKKNKSSDVLNLAENSDSFDFQ